MTRIGRGPARESLKIRPSEEVAVPRIRLLALVASLAALPATAQNLLSNPDFTGSLSGWATLFFDPCGSRSRGVR